MSMIKTQIDNLRYASETFESVPVQKLLHQAADTIEFLSEKLQASNMEREAGDCGGWIYCGDGKNLPKGENEKVIVSAVWDGYEYTTESYFYHGKFYNKPYYQISAGEICESCTGDEVVAWKSFPEPYHEP